MKHLGTLPFHAEASRGGTSSRRPGYLEPHRAGVKACAEHGNSLETTPAAPVVGGFFRPLSGGVPMQWIAVGVCAALRQARHPSAAAGEPMCCGAARQKPRFARRRTPRPALDPAKPLSGGMTTCERFWNAPPQAERLERRSCHPNAAGDLSRFWIGKAPVKRTPKGIRKAGAQRPALDQSVGETRQGRQAREMLRHYPATSAHACNCGAPRAGAATSHQRGAALDPKGAA